MAPRSAQYYVALRGPCRWCPLSSNVRRHEATHVRTPCFEPWSCIGCHTSSRWSRFLKRVPNHATGQLQEMFGKSMADQAWLQQVESLDGEHPLGMERSSRNSRSQEAATMSPIEERLQTAAIKPVSPASYIQPRTRAHSSCTWSASSAPRHRSSLHKRCISSGLRRLARQFKLDSYERHPKSDRSSESDA